MKLVCLGLRAGQNFDKDGFYTIESRFNGWHYLHCEQHSGGVAVRVNAINSELKQYYNNFQTNVNNEFKSLRSKIAPKVTEIRIPGLPAIGENFVTKVLTSYDKNHNIIIGGLMGSRIVLVPSSIQRCLMEDDMNLKKLLVTGLLSAVLVNGPAVAAQEKINFAFEAVDVGGVNVTNFAPNGGQWALVQAKYDGNENTQKAEIDKIVNFFKLFENVLTKMKGAKNVDFDQNTADDELAHALEKATKEHYSELVNKYNALADALAGDDYQKNVAGKINGYFEEFFGALALAASDAGTKMSFDSGEYEFNGTYPVFGPVFKGIFGGNDSLDRVNKTLSGIESFVEKVDALAKLRVSLENDALEQGKLKADWALYAFGRELTPVELEIASMYVSNGAVSLISGEELDPAANQVAIDAEKQKVKDSFVRAISAKFEQVNGGPKLEIGKIQHILSDLSPYVTYDGGSLDNIRLLAQSFVKDPDEEFKKIAVVSPSKAFSELARVRANVKNGAMAIVASGGVAVNEFVSALGEGGIVLQQPKANQNVDQAEIQQLRAEIAQLKKGTGSHVTATPPQSKFKPKSAPAASVRGSNK